LALLLGGVTVAAVAARWLEVRGALLEPPPAAPLFLAFGACLILSYLAGRRAVQDVSEPAVEAPHAPPASPSRRRLARVFGAGSLALFVATWILQRRVPVPLEVVPLWLGSILMAAAAFSLAFPGPRGKAGRRMPWPAVVVLALLLAAGAWARLAGLSAVPAVLGGDESSQVLDAFGLLGGAEPGAADPFGTGWYGTMRLGMLPAGVGALAVRDPVAGPRLPFALSGTLALLAATAAGWLIAGTWGALGTAGLLAFAPHSIHFSRLASVMVLDSLLASLFLVLAIRARSRGTALDAFWTGSVAGMALYAYSAGRVLPVLLVLITPALLGSPAGGRRLLLAAALAAGFALAAAPGLRFAFTHFADWNSRFDQVQIFRHAWWVPEVEKVGSPGRVLLGQVLAGTVGLLAGHSQTTWFKGYPIVAPFVLPALAAAGLGWLVGLRRRFAAGILGLLVAANLAALMLTDSAPAPQRLSSLFPGLAILGGAALSGLVCLVGRFRGARSSTRATAGVVLLGLVLLLAVRGVPPWWDPSPQYGGDHAAMALAASRVLTAPRYRGEAVILDGGASFDSTFPSLAYLLPNTRFVDRDVEKTAGERPAAGLHWIIVDYLPTLLPEWEERYGISRKVLLPDPEDPRRDLAALVRVP